MSGKIMPALAAAVLLGATALASAEPNSDMQKGANAAHPNAAQRSMRAAKADRMAPRGGINDSAQYAGRRNSARGPFYYFAASPQSGSPQSMGRTYYDVAPGGWSGNYGRGPFYYFEGSPRPMQGTYYDMAPGVAPTGAGGYCNYGQYC
jgi:hypothetical protein